jgi:hypothetical protein
MVNWCGQGCCLPGLPEDVRLLCFTYLLMCDSASARNCFSLLHCSRCFGHERTCFPRRNRARGATTTAVEQPAMTQCQHVLHDRAYTFEHGAYLGVYQVPSCVFASVQQPAMWYQAVAWTRSCAKLSSNSGQVPHPCLTAVAPQLTMVTGLRLQSMDCSQTRTFGI